MTACHSFDPEIAAEVGVNAAVIYQNIVFWCGKNAANGRNEHEGRFYTYNSARAFAVQFPYLTERQIRIALERLEDVGLIGTANLNKSPMDRTKWYCLLRHSHLAPASNPSDADGEAIPDIKPYYKPYTPAREAKPESDPSPIKISQQDIDRFWSAYPETGRVNYAKANLPTALGRHIARLGGAERVIAAAKAYADAIKAADSKPVALFRWLADSGLVDQYAPASVETNWTAHVDLFRKYGKWMAEGPPPGDPACLAPADVLSAAGYAPGKPELRVVRAS